jgi:anaerobic selenocysteine-containing dehydrogenase/Fe-S-cluster-containing dehydrogenase component
MGLLRTDAEMADFSRRDFLKAVSLAGAGAAFGCSSDSPRRLIPYIIPPEDIVPGEAAWYATTCRECPAGCGLLAKNRDGHVIKVEGNPLHPVNAGKLCPRGQASIQGIYNPDRHPGPRRKNAQGSYDSIPWDAAEKVLVESLRPLHEKGRGERIVFLSDLITGTLPDLIRTWLMGVGSPGPLLYEPIAYEPLRRANQWIFGLDGIPTYHIDQADFLISFGANFLETWVSNVQYARQFVSFRTPRARENFFIYVGPRLSLTAASADQWIPVSPDVTAMVAWGLLKVLLEKDLPFSLSRPQLEAVKAKVEGITPEGVQARTGVSRETLHFLAQRFVQAKRPLVLAEGLSGSDLQATETAIAANLLCALFPGSRQTLDLSDPSSLGEVVRAEKMKELTQRMLQRDIDLLFISEANPLFSLPPAWEFKKALETVPMVVSFSAFPDETNRFAHLVLPTHTFLESWGDFIPRQKVRSLFQPVMGPMVNTRHLGDILLSTGRTLKGEGEFPSKNFYEYLRKSWEQTGKKDAPGVPAEIFWQESLRKGGTWSRRNEDFSRSLVSGSAKFTFPMPSLQVSGSEEKSFHFVTYPTIQFFDGRNANRPFLQELPDPMTQITWGGWVEINPETAAKLEIKKDDLLTLKSPYGSWRAPAYPYLGIPPGILAMPIGQGHSAYGRFAAGQSGNPIQGISPHLDPSSGGIVWSVSGVTIQKLDRTTPLANTDGSLYQHGRGLAQSVSWQEYGRQKADQKPSIIMPLPQGFTKQDDIYPSHSHPEYRWAMVVDLDRCLGCGACVVACYAENNVAVVGKEQVLRGREMAWLHIERYFEPAESGQKAGPQIRFLPMLCQHCDEAPCEAVCPMFAPHHSQDGINNQVYNRCIGTRFCSQNCPYKARRFNWFTWPRSESLNWHLNPDVTVRHKGVMEKCSFCIQRIVAAKVQAKSEGRKTRDGEFTTACAQTCPAEVFTFGNLLDPQSRVAKLIQDPRAYQVLGQLNTKPAVIYLKKIVRKI